MASCVNSTPCAGATAKWMPSRTFVTYCWNARSILTLMLPLRRFLLLPCVTSEICARWPTEMSARVYFSGRSFSAFSMATLATSSAS